MVNSLSYNGVRLDSIEGVAWESTSRPIIPSAKELKISPNNVDGDYNFSTANVDGRPHYDSVVHSGVIHITGKDLTDCQIKASRISAILFSNLGQQCNIIFDDTPHTVWFGSHDGSTKTTYVSYRRIDLEVNFSCYPFPTHINSPVSLNFKINESLDYTFTNVGTWFCRPVLEFRGNFSNLSVRYRGKELRYSGVSVEGDITVIDFLNHTTYKNGIPMGEYLEGEFAELPTGQTQFIFTCSGSADCTLRYVPYYVGNAEGGV